MGVCMFRCNLHIWQNDGGLLRATAVTCGGTDTEKGQHRKLTLEKKILLLLLPGLKLTTFRSQVGRFTSELSWLLVLFYCDLAVEMYLRWST